MIVVRRDNRLVLCDNPLRDSNIVCLRLDAQRHETVGYCDNWFHIVVLSALIHFLKLLLFTVEDVAVLE